MRTEICITIDTEFSIGGAFADPDANEPVGPRMVHCPAGGADQGLGFLLETFARWGIRATFFVEALNHCHFGDGPMAEIAGRILAAGQDVQLHLHPAWHAFADPGWKAALAAGPPNDSFALCDAARARELIALGLAAFARWGMPRPVALRTGSLSVARATYEAMAALGIPLASNVGLALFRPAEPELQLASGRHRVGEVLELPVLTYRDLRTRAGGAGRLLTVTSTSWPEMRALLGAARRAGVETVVILTHPFEFIKTGDMQYRRLRRNRVNQARLEALCRFVAENGSDFTAVNFRDGGARWRERGATANVVLSVPAAPSLARMVENRLNDLIWAW